MIKNIYKMVMVMLLVVSSMILPNNHDVMALENEFKYCINMNEVHQYLLTNNMYQIVFEVDETTKFINEFIYEDNIKQYKLTNNMISKYLSELKDQEIIQVHIYLKDRKSNIICYETVMDFSKKDWMLELIVDINKDDIKLQYEDQDKPIIQAINLSTTNITSQLEMQIDAIDNYDRLRYEVIYQENKQQVVNNNIISINQNGYYYVFVSDGINQVAYEHNPIEIINIDKKAPKYSDLKMIRKQDGIHISFKGDDEHLDKLKVLVNNQLLNVDDNGYYHFVTNDTQIKMEMIDEALNKYEEIFDLQAAYVNHELQIISNEVKDHYSESIMLTLNAKVVDDQEHIYKYQYSLDGINYQEHNQFEIDQNGIYYGYVKDEYGNIATNTIEITTINKYAPTIENFKYYVNGNSNTNEYTKDDVNITFDIKDQDNEIQNYQVEVYQNQVMIEVINDVQSHFEYHIKTNGQYRFKVLDVGMKSSEQVININMIDQQAPTFDYQIMTYPQTPFMNYIKMAEISLSQVNDDLSGINEVDCFAFKSSLSNDKTLNWQAKTTKITVIENMNYTLYVRDKAGNISQKEIVFTNIDNQKPLVSVKGTAIESQNNYCLKYQMQIKINDLQSGIDKQHALSLDNGDTWISLDQLNKIDDGYQYEFIVTTNQILTIKTKDALGNISDPITYTIDNIDHKAPIIHQIHYDNLKWDTSKEITINASDNQSGIKTYAYQKDNGIKQYLNHNKFTVNENGTYIIYVEDYLGNISQKVIEITKIDQNAPQLSYQLKKMNMVEPNYCLTNNGFQIDVEVKDEQEIIDLEIIVEKVNSNEKAKRIKLKTINIKEITSLNFQLETIKDETMIIIRDQNGNIVNSFHQNIKLEAGMLFNLQLIVIDSCGNQKQYPVSIDKQKINFMIDNKKMTINLIKQDSKNIYKDQNDTMWISKNNFEQNNFELQYQIHLNDQDSGINTFMITTSNEEKKQSDLKLKDPFIKYKVLKLKIKQGQIKENKTYDLFYELNDQKILFKLQNNQINKPLTILLKGKDYANNTQEMIPTLKLQIDDEAPIFNINKSIVESKGKKYEYSEDLLKQLQDSIDTKQYCYFFKDEVTFKLNLNDQHSGIKTVRYGFNDGKEYEASIDNNTYNIKINANYKGKFYFYAIDHVGNQTKKYYISIIVADEIKHMDEQNIDIELLSTKMIYKKGIYYTNDNVEAIFKFQDHYCGIKEINLINNRKINKALFNVNFNKDGILKKIANVSLFDLKNDSNIVIDMKAKTIIDQEGTYYLDASFIDNANYTSDYQGSKIVILDQSKPTIDISYEGKKMNNYDNDGCKAVIKVNDLYIDDDCIKKVVYQKDNELITLDQKAFKQNKDGSYTCIIDFKEDGIYRIDYIEVQDIAGNISTQTKQEKITIDKTKPIIDVSFKPNHQDYYNQEQDVKISIKEKNFDPSKIKTNIIHIDYDGNKKTMMKTLDFISDGSIHHASFKLKADGIYQFQIFAADKANNEANVFESNQFIIDLIDPTINVNIEHNKAYADDIKPLITISDQNLDIEHSTFTLLHSNGKEVDLKPHIVSQEKTKKITFDSFPNLIKYDDVYTLIINARDKANRKYDQTITFSINRFGSNYQVLSDISKALNEEIPIVIKEVNVNEISDVIITINYKNQLITLKQNQDYTITSSKDNWYKNIYTIKQDVFEKDGTYYITITSKDTTERLNSTQSPSKKVNLVITVDKHAPQIVAVNVESNKIYEAVSKEIIFKILDNVKLADQSTFEVKLNERSLNDDEYEYDVVNQELRIKVNEDSQKQNISIKVYDIANNEQIITISNILITSDKITIILSKYGSLLICIVILIVMMIMAILMKKKKSN